MFLRNCYLSLEVHLLLKTLKLIFYVPLLYLPLNFFKAKLKIMKFYEVKDFFYGNVR